MLAFWRARDSFVVGQVSADAKRAARLCRPHVKTAVELGHVLLQQKGIGRSQCRDPSQRQFLRQPALPGAEVAFTASRENQGRFAIICSDRVASEIRLFSTGTLD